MSAPVAFSSQATAQRTCPKTTVGAFGFSPVRTCQFKSDEMKIVKQQLCVRARVRNKLYKGGKLKVEVMDFFGQLIDSMGQNIEFKIGNVCEGDDDFYGWSNLAFRRAQGVIESPIKPGHSSLILLKMVTSLFDAFPKATEWFLKSPDAILKAILKVYSMVLGPFISPFLAWYIKYWKFMQYLLSSALKILVFLSKIFDK
ncbi:hypothetical protein Acr_15g0000620 [Actinidia rufa]|uniref:Uncharacterized protein n=1 Tax=Actinidia rufa TaxID=165716 RepID=A0A7J0FRY9_9ERIC|nr:hypothetical protein Acr_15g0000620 [Actinidia rufa]